MMMAYRGHPMHVVEQNRPYIKTLGSKLPMTGDGVALFVKESSLFSVTYLIKPPQKCRLGFHVFSCF